MKYIQYTLVDNKTNKPLSEAPAKNGPKVPDGVTPKFAVQQSFGASPVFYGTAPNTFTLKEWMVEVDEEGFTTALQNEYKDRARVKRKEIEEGGFQIDSELRVRTDEGSQSRLAQLVTTINNDPDVTSIDFETIPGTWVTLTPEQAVMIAKTVSRHVQRCYSWCKGIHKKVEEAPDDIAHFLDIDREINDFGSDEDVDEEESLEEDSLKGD